MASLEHLGQSWGTLWDTWVSIETSSGRLGTALEILRPPETPSQAEGSQVPRLRTKIDPLELASGSSRSRGHGSQTTVQTPPSTRAGDQDDVSFTNSLK